MKFVNNLPTLQRNRRGVPLFLGALALIGVIAGPGVSTYKIARNNAGNIEQIANITDIHSQVMKNSTQFFDQFRSSISTLHNWAEEVDERLGDSDLDSILNADPTFRGKRAHLVKTYMQWFDAQERMLTDINQAASRHQVSSSLKEMLNGTSDFDKAVNLSTLFDCKYRLEDKNLVLELEFTIPTIDKELDVLKVRPQDVYRFYNHTDDRGEEFCWETYVGPSYVIHNKTNGCIKALGKNRMNQYGVRGATCLEEINDLYLRGDSWDREECNKEVPKIGERIQIDEINGAHKIYCFPFNIKINGTTQPCPLTPFILEGHANYEIQNITHYGDYIDTAISRRLSRSLNKRLKRSALPLPTTELSPKLPVTITTGAVQPNQMTIHTAKHIATEETTTPNPQKVKLTDQLKNLTSQMNITITKIKDSLKMLPDRINMTRAELDTFLNTPFEMLGDSIEQIVSYVKSLGTFMGVLSIVMVIIIIMPILEIAILTCRVAKIPAGLWLSSARRVALNVKSLTEVTRLNLPLFMRKKQRRRNQLIKMT